MSLAALIDHTILKAEATEADVDRLVQEAVRFGFASVCVNGRFVERVAKELQRTGVATCAVVGFPLGANKPLIKAIEATSACKDGADEIDFVAHLPHLLAADEAAALQDFLPIVQGVRDVKPSAVVKVIIESAVLMKDADAATAERRIAAACAAAQRAGCDFVKTSTGFHPTGGATVDAVQLMKKHARDLEVKASGGIRTREDAQRMVDAGATRLGCSAGVQIVQGETGGETY